MHWMWAETGLTIPSYLHSLRSCKYYEQVHVHTDVPYDIQQNIKNEIMHQYIDKNKGKKEQQQIEHS